MRQDLFNPSFNVKATIRDKENIGGCQQQQQSGKEFKPKSPSKMTDEEKIQYKNRLFKEADELNYIITRQLNELDKARTDARMEVKQSKDLQTTYRKEQEAYNQRIEAKRKEHVNNNFLNLPNDIIFKQYASPTASSVQKSRIAVNYQYFE